MYANKHRLQLMSEFRHSDLFDQKASLPGRVRSWAKQQIWTQKFKSPLGWALLLLATVPISYLLAVLDFKISLLAFGVLIGFPLVVLCLFHVPFAIGMMLFVAACVPIAVKFTGAPIGTLLDLLILLSTVGILLRQIQERNWAFMRAPLATMTLIWLYYNVLQVLNPWAESKMAWLYTVRSVAVQQVVFFIALYAYQSNRRAILLILKSLLLLGAVYAVYGLKQEFLGFSEGEKAWIYSNEERFQLVYQWGRLRIMSLCADPTTFGILMACFSMFCVALFIGPTKIWQKALLAVFALCALWAMAYSGTRTAVALVPLGALFYGGLILNRKVLLAGSVLAIIGGLFILKPTSNPVIWRIQSAFKVKTDESMNVRFVNQRRIQPYIQSHPFGGGLGSCGVWGKRFTPNSELANFPHDSSFVRMGVELGWIGLILYTLFHYFVLHTGIYYFIRCRDPFIKSVYAGATTWCFMLTVACYAQEAILQLPMNIIYNILLGILLTLKNFDPNFENYE